MEKRKCSLGAIGFLQALGLAAYCSLIAFFMFNANKWFGKVDTYFAPFLFLILFTTSALISAIITLGRPFVLYFGESKKIEAIKLVIYTAAWLVVFAIITILLLILLK